MNNDSDYTFSLYVSGIDLTEINPIDSARLLEALCKMLGSKHLKWGDIKQGSADFAVKIDPEYVDEKVVNVSKAISDETGAFKTITEFLNKHPAASTLLRYKNSSNDEYIKLHEFKRKDEGFVFTQQESIRCRMVGIREGKDKTDYVYVETIAGKRIKVDLSPELAASMGAKYRTPHQLEITGIVKYKYRSYNDIELENFIATSIMEVERGNLKEWVSEFINAGDSGWSEFDDPMDAWLRERHE